MARTGTELLFLYNQAGVIVNQLGYDNWSEEIIHSDWHPGNMLFSNHKVVAVLDLETVRKAPAICDLGNGALQFSIVSGRPQPSDWPDYLDTERLTAFLDGYNAVTELPEEKIRSVPFLMIETMICESVLPIATTGSFGKLDGGDFLDMIFRKSKWIFDNKDSLTKTLLS
jgi:Ser/Thr protein kinase RdoA (MazF antagonist)